MNTLTHNYQQEYHSIGNTSNNKFTLLKSKFSKGLNQNDDDYWIICMVTAAHAHKVEERNSQCRHISHSLFSIDQNPCARPCHLKVWFGDLNYRVQGISNQPARSLIRNNLQSVSISIFPFNRSSRILIHNVA